MPDVSWEKAESTLVLSLDIGSSSVRASLYDRRAFPLDNLTNKHEYDLVTTPDGGVEKDPEDIAHLTFRAIDELLLEANVLVNRIGAVVLDTFWHGMIGLDGDNHPLTPLLTWADTRAAQASEQLKIEKP
jgi:gluconokinase